MDQVPADLRECLCRFGQDHVLDFWDQLHAQQRQKLVDQLRLLELEELQRLFQKRHEPATLPAPHQIEPVKLGLPVDRSESELCTLGKQALDRGEVALLVVAGGQGSRLGFDKPKGMFPVTPVKQKTLFQLHAEKVRALRQRHSGQPIPFLIMTSPATHADTLDYFKQEKFFGLPQDELFFIQQGTMPALCLETGKLLLEAPHQVFASPNGHGGMLTALAESGVLATLHKRGIRQLFYFQVDNPLIKLADPLFLGQHLAAHAEVSSKAVPKLDPLDRLGNLVVVDGRCTIIEYSDMPRSLAELRDETGELRYRAGSPAIHFFALEFLERITQKPDALPFHLARKKVPHIDRAGRAIEPEKENALKFERFIFDVLPLAERWTVVETSYAEEFAPLKNASGADSPQAVAQAQSDFFAGWLEEAGVQVPRQEGKSAVPIEISPLYALDADELAAKVDRSLKVAGPLYLGS
ncbi:MAG: UTP--glucose-1-phosphate uridylyltransferase [Gemmataceae bacterium]